MKNKPLVETSSRGILQKREQITNYLTSHPEGATPKMIATATSLNVNTIKSILPKLENVKSVTRGWYKVVNRGDAPFISDGTLHDWNFHNLILTFPVETQKNIQYNKSFDLVDLNFIINNKGICTCRVSTDYPINVSSITLIYGYINLFFDLELSMKDIQIKTIEFNKDYTNIRMDGVNCITLDGLCSQFKLYQKQIGLRQEHKTKINFNAQTMVDMLANHPASTDISTKMAEQRAMLTKLTGQTVRNTAILNELTKRLRT